MSVNVRFADEDVWLTNNLFAEIYATTRQDIDYHIANIYADGELSQEATCKKYLQITPPSPLPQVFVDRRSCGIRRDRCLATCRGLGGRWL